MMLEGFDRVDEVGEETAVIHACRRAAPHGRRGGLSSAGQGAPNSR